MKKTVLILVYFGKLPAYANAFFKSVEYNKSVDLLFISDQQSGCLPSNVRQIKISFDDLKDEIQSEFDFPITLDSPYKLVDYKPAYGLIFHKYIEMYEFWGHVDMDMIFGNISHFINNSILEKFDKIYQFGHLTLYRNNYENNRRFMSDEGMNYRDVFSTSLIKVFDETQGMQRKFELMNIPTYISNDFADIAPWKYRMYEVGKGIYNKPNQVYVWSNGILNRYYIEGSDVKKNELLYVHFQKRNMAISMSNQGSKYYIISSHKIFKNAKLDYNFIKQYSYSNFFLDSYCYLKYQYYIWNRRYHKYVLGR